MSSKIEKIFHFSPVFLAAKNTENYNGKVKYYIYYHGFIDLLYDITTKDSFILSIPIYKERGIVMQSKRISTVKQIICGSLAAALLWSAGLLLAGGVVGYGIVLPIHNVMGLGAMFVLLWALYTAGVCLYGVKRQKKAFVLAAICALAIPIICYGLTGLFDYLLQTTGLGKELLLPLGLLTAPYLTCSLALAANMPAMPLSEDVATLLLLLFYPACVLLSLLAAALTCRSIDRRKRRISSPSEGVV